MTMTMIFWHSHTILRDRSVLPSIKVKAFVSAIYVKPPHKIFIIRRIRRIRCITAYHRIFLKMICCLFLAAMIVLV